MRLTTLSLLIASLLSSPAGTQALPAGRQAPSSAALVAANKTTPELRLQSFEVVWRTVKERHFDPTFGGVDWDRVHADYLPKLDTVKTDAEFYGLLQQMLGELHQSHFGIIPPEAIVDDSSREPSVGGVGITLRLVDGVPVVVSVQPGSPAARAMLTPGFIVQKVDDVTTESIAARINRGNISESLKHLFAIRAISGKVSGDPGTPVKISFLDGSNQPREVTLTRERLPGEMSPKMGNFPPQYTEFETRRLEGGIAYIRFNIFVVSLMERIKTAIRSLGNAPGLILDLRGNPGGVGGMSMGIAGLLEDKEISLGRQTMRSGYMNYSVYPQRDAFLGPVVILTDEMSASTSEVFAMGMQENGRALIVGERSAGAALPSVIQKLPTGALFQYAIADFKSPKGTLIEGHGVVPNVPVKMDRATLLKGHDPQLDAAVRSIQEQAGKGRKAA